MRFTVLILLGLFSATLGQKSRLECGLQGQCQGEVLSKSTTSSEQECINSCRDDFQCSWYTFQTGDNTCTLFENCPSIDDSCNDCISGEQGCQAKGFSKLLVYAGGIYRSEVIDLDNPDNECEDFKEMPTDGDAGAGGLFIGEDRASYTILDCGGFPGGGVTKNCYSPGSFQVQVTMTMARGYPAGLSRGQPGSPLWITGGFIGGGKLTDTTELVLPGQESVPHTNLPEPLNQHCLTYINATTAMLIGGENEVRSGSKNTYFYDESSGEWTPGPKLSTGRESFACGTIKAEDGNQIVVAAGGDKGPATLDAYDITELWTEADGEWIRGPDMPVGLEDHRAIVTSDGSRFIVVGGYNLADEDGESNRIHELTCRSVDDCTWKTLSKTLKDARRNFDLVLIPDKLATCSSK